MLVPDLVTALTEAAGVHAVLRREAARRDAEFLQRVGKRQRQAAVFCGSLCMAPSSVYATPNGRPPATEMFTPPWKLRLLRPSRLHGRAGEHDQVGDLASLQRQLHDPLLLDDLLMPALRTSTSGAAASTVTVSSSVADGERDVDRRRGADLQHDAGLHVGAEPCERHLEPVGTGRQVRHHVASGVVGDDACA